MTAPQSFRTRQTGGFTLLELLVVVALAGVLKALLLSALSRARNSARNVACISNLNELPAGYDYTWSGN